MPRTENDKRTPYAKATARRVTRGLDLVGKIRAELATVEAALISGLYVYHTSLAELAARLGATMAELEALEEMHDDTEAVAKLAEHQAAHEDPDDLRPQERNWLRELAAGPRDSGEIAAQWRETGRGTGFILNLESLVIRGLATSRPVGDGEGRIYEITDAGWEALK